MSLWKWWHHKKVILWSCSTKGSDLKCSHRQIGYFCREGLSIHKLAMKLLWEFQFEQILVQTDPEDTVLITLNITSIVKFLTVIMQ